LLIDTDPDAVAIAPRVVFACETDADACPAATVAMEEDTNAREEATVA
jgi:hypothetical protein